MSDDAQPGDIPEMSDEEVREYLEKVRSAPAEQVVSDVISVVLNAASAKVGRRDGRLLIDLAGIIVEHARAHIPAEFATQVDRLLGQLRLGQVQAERDYTDEPNDLASAPASPQPASPQPASPQPASPQPASPQPASPQPPPASKLWIPGRG